MACRHGITAFARTCKGQGGPVLRVPHFGRSALVQGARQRGENSFLYFSAHRYTSAASSSGESNVPSSWIRCPSALTSLPALFLKRPPCSISSSFFAGAGEAGTTGAGMGAVAGSSSIGFGLVCGILCLLSSSFVSIHSPNRYEGKTSYRYRDSQQVRCWRGIRRVVGQQTSCSNAIPNPKAKLTAIAFTAQGPDFIFKLEIELTAPCHARPHCQRLLRAANEHGYHVVGGYPWFYPNLCRPEHTNRPVRDVHHVEVAHGICLVH